MWRLPAAKSEGKRAARIAADARRTAKRFPLPSVWWIVCPPAPQQSKERTFRPGRLVRRRFPRLRMDKPSPPERIHDRVFTAIRRSLSERRFRSRLALSLCHLSRRFPLLKGAGRSLILRDSRGHSVIRCRQLAAKPAPARAVTSGGMF